MVPAWVITASQCDRRQRVWGLVAWSPVFLLMLWIAAGFQVASIQMANPNAPDWLWGVFGALFLATLASFLLVPLSVCIRWRAGEAEMRACAESSDSDPIVPLAKGERIGQLEVVELSGERLVMEHRWVPRMVGALINWIVVVCVAGLVATASFRSPAAPTSPLGIAMVVIVLAVMFGVPIVGVLWLANVRTRASFQRLGRTVRVERERRVAVAVRWGGFGTENAAAGGVVEESGGWVVVRADGGVVRQLVPGWPEGALGHWQARRVNAWCERG